MVEMPPDREALGKLHFISNKRVNEIMQNFNEDFLLYPYLEKDPTIQELKDLVPKVISWSTKDYQPVALTALYIARATGYSLKGGVGEAVQKDLLEKAILFDDLAQGVMGTMNGVFVATGNLRSYDIADELLQTINYIKSTAPDQDSLKITSKLTQEDILQRNLLKDDITGSSLVDYWVKVIEEGEDEIKKHNLKSERISEFVIRGAHVARRIYKIVYSLARESLSM